MSTYILLANFTDQGIRNIKGSPARVEAAREVAQSFDVRFKDLYVTLGGYDIVAILEAGQDEGAGVAGHRQDGPEIAGSGIGVDGIDLVGDGSAVAEVPNSGVVMPATR